MDVNNKLMHVSTSEKGKHLIDEIKRDHTEQNLVYDEENKLYHHKWAIPSNTVGTMSSPNFRTIPGDNGVQDATAAIRPKIVRPLSALSVKKPHYNLKHRPASASSFVFTFHNFTPSIVVNNPID